MTDDDVLTARPIEWPPPDLFADEAIGKIPSDLLPSDIGRYAEALALATETPPELATLMILGTISCALGGKVAVEPEAGYIEPCHLFLAPALESGNRKTAVVSAATAPLTSWESKQFELLKPDLQRLTSERKTSEAIIEKMRRNLSADPNGTQKNKQAQAKIAELEASLPVVPVAPQLWTSDSTPEKLECLLAQHRERFAVISDEGGIFDILGGRYSNKANLDMFLKGHAGSPVRVHRTSREEVTLHQPALTLAISPQPGVLRDLQANPAFRHRGLLARILYALPPSNVGNRHLTPRPIPGAVRERYESTIEGLLNWQPRERLTLSLCPTAHRLWKDFQMLVESEMRPGKRLFTIRDWGSKLPGATLRIAGLLHIAAQSNLSNLSLEIAQPTIDVALTLGRTFISHALAVFRLISEDDETRNAKQVLTWLLQQDSISVSKRDCFRAHQHVFGKVDQFNAALKTLEQRKLIRLVKRGTATKSEELIAINPALLQVG